MRSERRGLFHPRCRHPGAAETDLFWLAEAAAAVWEMTRKLGQVMLQRTLT